MNADGELARQVAAWIAYPLVFAMVIALNQGPIPALMAEMLPTRIRSSANGIAFNVTLGVVGGAAPLAGTWLVARTGDLAAPPPTSPTSPGSPR